METKIIHTKDRGQMAELSDLLLNHLYTKSRLPWCERSQPDDHTFIEAVFIFRNDFPVGKLYLYRNDELSFEDKKPLLVGNYECENSDEISAILINETISFAKSSGYDFLIGPMNGSTWNTYRFAEDWKEPVFFSEKYHHAYYNEQWINNGFEVISGYFSSYQDELSYDEEYLERKLKEYKDNEIIVRSISLENLEEDLRKIFPLCAKAFAANPFFTSVSEDFFVQKYLAFKEYINPEIVLVAEQNEQALGFIFCLLNYADVNGKGLIVKTIARDEDIPASKGLGAVFSSMVVKYTKDHDLKYMLHAFMHSANNSKRLSEKFAGRLVRKYHLYGRSCK